MMQTTPPASEARIAIQPGFAWDAQDAYLFDIDGTLLRSRDRIHFNSFAAAMQQVTGHTLSLEGVVVHGSTDTAILRDAIRLSGLPEEAIEAQVRAILEAMCVEVTTRRGELNLVLMPGVEDMLRYLARRGALLGVGTGNLEAIGWTKIETVGLRQWFRFGGFSDHFPDRAELIGDAARKARELAGPAARVCVVGDTPSDIEAARANALPCIAVATGKFSFDELLEYGPEACVSTLADLLAQNGSVR